jgi:hypothetical protein
MPATATRAATAGGFTLTAEVCDSLRRKFPREEDEDWALRVAIDEGWEESNARYLRWQEIKGRLEMAALMKSLGVRRAESPGMTAGLMALASELFEDPAAPETVKGARKYLREGWYEAMGAGGGEADG